MKWLLILMLCSFGVAQAFDGGDKVGGGGDASEERVNEIRADILKWIKADGAQDLILENGTTYEEYKSKMEVILQPQKVIIGFVASDNELSEFRVKVSDVPKTCRGFIFKENNLPYIICNIDRFRNLTDAEQYRLIHHEYAGLAGLEKNEGAASDYSISSQITDYLTEQMVLRLAVKREVERRKISYQDVQKGLSAYQVQASKVLKCARDLSTKYYDNVTRRKAAAEVIEKLIKRYKYKLELNSLETECKSYKKIRKEEYESKLNDEVKFSRKTDVILHNFIYPKIVCKDLSLLIGGGVIVGAGIEVGGGVCFATNGKRWLEVEAGAGWAAGLGANVGVSFETIEARAINSIFNSKKHELGVISLGVGIVETYANEITGVSIGIGGYGSRIYNFGMKILPLPTSKKTLVKLLEESN